MVGLDELAAAFRAVLREADRHKHLNITRETLSVRERMTHVLEQLKNAEFVDFQQLFEPAEGRMGLVVTFIAILELYKDSMLVVVQSEPFAPIHVTSVA